MITTVAIKIDFIMLNKTKLFIILGISLVVASIIFFLIPYLILHNSWGWNYDQSTGRIGDTIGGISGPLVGFIGIILTFFAFYIQFQANQVQIKALNEQKIFAIQQEKQILLQQFESNYFELLKIHRENVSELNYRNSEGRNVIIKIVNEFFEIMQIILDKGIIRKSKLGEQDLANISFIILFFGTDETVTDALENRFFNKYFNIYESIVEVITIMREKENPYKNGYYYNGHQSRLGHYFRHLKRSIDFVHNNNLLTKKQKNEYVQILRAQLSNHEQILLFFNSISDFGLKWELEAPEDKKLISTYGLIRNIPLGSIYGYRPKAYYPNLEMEHDFEIRL